MDTLVNKELTPTAFKLLELLDPEGGVPRGRLLETTLDQCPRFAALSYVWGPESPARAIWLDGQRVSVRENLWDFLIDAAQRRPWSMGEPDFIESRYLWVDALCINQDDAHQKSRQVKLMGRIFSKAVFVVAWLGKWDIEYDCQAALSWLVERNKYEMTRLLGKVSDPDYDDEDLASILKNGPSLLALFDHKYFSRAWIVQEVVLATEIIFICGSQCVHWNTIASFANTLFKRRHRDQLVGVPLTAQLADSTGWRIMRARKTWWGRPFMPNRGVPLEILLVAFRFTQCTLLHDKVYALLSLVESKDESQDLEDIQVDYTKPIVEVYHDVLRHVYQKAAFTNTTSLDQQRFIRMLQRLLKLDPHDAEVDRVTCLFVKTLDVTIDGVPNFYDETASKLARDSNAMLEQYLEAELRKEIEGIQRAKAERTWDPLVGLLKRDATS